VSQALAHVWKAARQRKKERFTAVFHHLDPAMFRNAFFALKRNAAPDVDGFLSHLHSLMVTMSQKSSVPQVVKSASQVLMPDRMRRCRVELSPNLGDDGVRRQRLELAI
jgi:hypothetical protein